MTNFQGNSELKVNWCSDYEGPHSFIKILKVLKISLSWEWIGRTSGLNKCRMTLSLFLHPNSICISKFCTHHPHLTAKTLYSRLKFYRLLTRGSYIWPWKTSLNFSYSTFSLIKHSGELKGVFYDILDGSNKKEYFLIDILTFLMIVLFLLSEPSQEGFWKGGINVF